ncbi:virulence RhuM family protein [uncultured Tessaracoccus sp.]|uniref:virulence RhuM family protein n=1 Tax=uncultured Tessaracoccus sp. TaxID=905023 RepID=UPI002637F881|nr:virulence RhuM family protein [uncultured Tessaracoccus sp.]
MNGSQGEILVYHLDDGTPAVEVQLVNESLWLSQQQIADLFQTSRENITIHLQNVYDEGELTAEATRKDFLQVRQEGQRQVQRKVAHYNLDAVISVGYRVKSVLATRFRIWATERLREYLVMGFTMDDEKLKNLGGGTYWQELLERIREIRSSEKAMYRQVLDLFATSVDYNPRSTEAREFFKVVQNKLHFGAHGHTAPEVVAGRADASKPHMGLISFRGSRPSKSDVTVAKKYLNEFELKQLGSLVSAYFEAAEFRAQRHEPTYMKDWLAHLDKMLTAMDAPILEGAGSISRSEADAKAIAEYDKYRAELDAEPSEVEKAYLASIKAEQKKLEGKQ